MAIDTNIAISGGVAQMVERSLSMREVPGSIPGASNINILIQYYRHNHLYFIKRKNGLPCQKYGLEAPGIDPGTSRMLSERSTI